MYNIINNKKRSKSLICVEFTSFFIRLQKAKQKVQKV
jgi:hypothetical protein